MYGNVVWGGEARENPVGLSKNDGLMETVEYIWMNIWCMLDWIVAFVTKLQKYASLAYSSSTSEECTKWHAIVAGWDELCGNSNPLQDLTFDVTAWWNVDFYTRNRTENEC